MLSFTAGVCSQLFQRLQRFDPSLHPMLVTFLNLTPSTSYLNFQTHLSRTSVKVFAVFYMLDIWRMIGFSNRTLLARTIWDKAAFATLSSGYGNSKPEACQL
jgi:hypothetical protein